jgi:ACS family tartrate transporter-like MFS transporter
MATTSTVPISSLGQRTVRRISMRLLPYLFILYIISFLDRVNVGFAGLEMTRDLAFSDRVFSLGAGVFFIGYFLLEIPGAIIVERWSARKWIARILITWGIVTIGMGFVHTAGQFYLVRFLLGAAEAGFFPGIVVYLTHWFRYEDRAHAGALFMAAIPISNIIGSPLAGWILGVHWLNLTGWRWLFIFEGIPAVIFGATTLFLLTDWPHQAHWLAKDEKEWIAQELQREKEAKAAVHSHSIGEALRHRDVLLLAAIYFLALIGIYGFNIWFPTIVKRATGLPNLTVALLSALPYVAGVIAMLWNGWSSDRTKERRWHTAFPLFLGGICLALAILLQNQLLLAFLAMIVVGACTTAFMPSFWALPTAILSESAAAASIGFINSTGNLGGFTGPFAIGYLSTATNSFVPGLAVVLTAMILSGALVFLLRIHRT